MRLKAMAKINLGLDVLGKREDGYHEVRMIMQTIRMYDILDIRKTRRPGIVLTTNLPFIPTDQRNLVYKAAQMLMEEFDVEEGLSIKLRKFIPVAAGMAGGSSDAAAAFVGVNRMFHLGLTEEQLMENIPKEQWSIAHHWLIWHGRRVCSARTPKCEQCPCEIFCDFAHKGSKTKEK